MTQHALVVGASRGIGLELTRQLLEAGYVVHAASRRPTEARELMRLAARHPELHPVAMDLTDEESIASAVAEVGSRTERLHRVLVVAGVLHGPGFGPERKLEELTAEALSAVFAVNAFGPILVAREVLPLLRHDEPAVFASLSARVGSISDNHKGGWYAYRASKAAQNMLTRTLTIELGRRAKNVCVLALHPGTVDTDLSKPFQRFVPEEQLFDVQRAARQLLDLTEQATPEQSGSFYAWDGSIIPW